MWVTRRCVDCSGRHITGQRKDGTGLLHYNARSYDPALGRFASADSVGVDRGDPQSRNRYSYVRNNPLKYTDPTGHCYDDPQNNEERAENHECDRQIETSAGYAVMVRDYANWMAGQLQFMIVGIQAMLASFNWSAADFRNAMGGGFDAHRMQDTSAHCNGVNTSCVTGNGTSVTMYLSDVTFREVRRAIEITHDIVHELAHVWDFAQQQAPNGGLVSATSGLISCLSDGQSESCRYLQGDRAHRPSVYSGNNQVEDFAESVANYVIQDEAPGAFLNGPDGSGSIRSKYVGCLGRAYQGRPDTPQAAAGQCVGEALR